jgi:hypothetical protein
MDAFLSSLERSPELLPLALNVQDDQVTLIRLSQADYRAASFLDERLLTPRTMARKLPWPEVAAAADAADLRERCHFIFHVGHVGSTLLSRLLGEDQRLFALREPAALRTLAQQRTEPETQPRLWDPAEFEHRLAVFLRLWSRTFANGETAVVKATSYVSDLAPQLLARPSTPKALLVTTRPENYFATILGGENAREEAGRLLVSRARRLARRLGVKGFVPSGEGEGLAIAWAVEMCGLVEAQRAAGTRTLTIDFDQFLAEPEPVLLAAFLHFGVDVPPARVNEILGGPLMQSYSKAPEHAYSPALRREILDEAHKAHAAQIDKGLAWLEHTAQAHPLIGECLAMAG